LVGGSRNSPTNGVLGGVVVSGACPLVRKTEERADPEVLSAPKFLCQ
jgi:hypothetical protein